MPGRFRRPRIALICPTNWDRLQIPRARARLARRFALVPYGPDAEADPGAFDADSFVERALIDLARLRVDAVISSSDYPGCILAAIIAERLGLPGAGPEAVLRSAHKYYARESMAISVPDATPWFTLLPPDAAAASSVPHNFPFFVKPVKSWFSQHARVVSSADDLADYLTDPELRRHLTDFVRPFNQMLRHYPGFEYNASHVIGEELLVGRQLTLEGYVLNDSVGVTGIVESTMYAGTSSFERFVYPSNVDPISASRMRTIAEHAVSTLGLTWSMFNIEFIEDPGIGSLHVVEVNPRMCGQFADLMEAVNGVNTYEVLCDVALGRRPKEPAESPEFVVAASYPRRRFTDGIIASVPTRRQIDRIKRQAPASLVAVYYQAGQRLSTVPKHFDGASYRYATINVAAADIMKLRSIANEVERRLEIKIIDD